MWRVEHLSICRSINPCHFEMVSGLGIELHIIEVHPKLVGKDVHVLDICVRWIILHNDQHPAFAHPIGNHCGVSFIHVMQIFVPLCIVRRNNEIDICFVQVCKCGCMGECFCLQTVLAQHVPENGVAAVGVIVPFVVVEHGLSDRK